MEPSANVSNLQESFMRADCPDAGAAGNEETRVRLILAYLSCLQPLFALNDFIPLALPFTCSDMGRLNGLRE